MDAFDFVVFDIETTGLDPAHDQIAEIAAIKCENGLPVGTFSTFVSIDGPMPKRAEAVNHITDDMLKGAPSISEALSSFSSFIGSDTTLVGHNIEGFDIYFIDRAAEACKVPVSYEGTIDTLRIARDIWPDRRHSMDSLRTYLGLPQNDAHRALKDCYDELALFNAESIIINKDCLGVMRAALSTLPVETVTCLLEQHDEVWEKLNELGSYKCR